MNKPKLAIISQSIRRDNQKPLQYFDKIEVFHFYNEEPYGDLTKEDLINAIKFDSFFDLYKKLLDKKLDIIQGTEPFGSRKMFVFSIVCYLVAKKLRIPLIFPVWENRPIKDKFNFWQVYIISWWMKKYAKSAAQIFYLNEGAKRNLLKLKIPSGKLTKFLWGTWGVDINEFKPLSVQEKKLQSNIFPSPVILFIGRLEPAKGIRYLLESFKKVVKRFPPIKLMIIGSGYLKEEVENFRQKNSLEKNIIIKGIIKNKNLPIYYKSAAVFVSPAITLKNWEEQVGMTNLQAMACGTPVVSTTSGAIPEYVPNKIVGFLVPQKDSRRLASTIIKILDANKLREKISTSARKYAIEHYDAKKNILHAQEIILKILHEKQL